RQAWQLNRLIEHLITQVPVSGRRHRSHRVEIMHFQQQAAGYRLERSMIRAGRPTRVGVGRKRGAALALRIVADDEVARHPLDLLPVIVDEGSGSEDAWRKSQQA